MIVPTTQNAPLENVLAWFRSFHVRTNLAGKNVLDFGCGARFNALRMVAKLAKSRTALDLIFIEEKPFISHDGIHVFGSINELANKVRTEQLEPFDCVLALACFEHMEHEKYKTALAELLSLTTAECVIIGTVPTPRAKPVLEFLSFQLGLIDPSQIKDHKVYYDKSALIEATSGTGWIMSEYSTFQFGMNSRFELRKLPL